MADDGPDAANSPEGVFGNLPSTRPGSRSPRRRGGTPEPEADSKAEAPKPVKASKPKPKAAPAPPPARPADPPPEPEPPQPADDPLAPQPGINGVEDLAWAGVAVVAQAATAGIRFTSKALEAARKSIDRP